MLLGSKFDTHGDYKHDGPEKNQLRLRLSQHEEEECAVVKKNGVPKAREGDQIGVDVDGGNEMPYSKKSHGCRKQTKYACNT